MANFIWKTLRIVIYKNDFLFRNLLVCCCCCWSFFIKVHVIASIRIMANIFLRPEQRKTKPRSIFNDCNFTCLKNWRIHPSHTLLTPFSHPSQVHFPWKIMNIFLIEMVVESLSVFPGTHFHLITGEDPTLFLGREKDHKRTKPPETITKPKKLINNRKKSKKKMPGKVRKKTIIIIFLCSYI